MISFNNYITANGRYPERLTSSELTDDLKNNAAKLLEKVNALLSDLGITEVSVTSGFRPSSVNANVANAAKKSLHMSCLAVDILDDKDQSLAKKIKEDAEKNKRSGLLHKHGLWLENPESTIGKNTNWVHLDISTSRKDRDVRIFKV